MIPARGPQTMFLASLGGQAKPAWPALFRVCWLGKSKAIEASLG